VAYLSNDLGNLRPRRGDCQARFRPHYSGNNPRRDGIAAFFRPIIHARDFVRPAGLGIHGNGHFMMLEKNNLQIAEVIADWLSKRVTPIEAQHKSSAP
jgi:hypothetical protein